MFGEALSLFPHISPFLSRIHPSTLCIRLSPLRSQVSSVRTLLGEKEVNIKDLVGDEADLQRALTMARNGKIEWLQQQSSLLGKKDEPEYSFRHVPNNRTGQAV